MRKNSDTTTQIRRAAVSIPNNFAEGSGRKSDKEFSQFLSISLGSANEVEYLIELTKDLGYIKSEDIDELFALITEIQSMLYALINKKVLDLKPWTLLLKYT